MRVRRQAAQDDALDSRIKIFFHGGRRNDMARFPFLRAGAFEDPLAGKDLVQDQPQTVYIGLQRESLVRELLGRHIGQGAGIIQIPHLVEGRRETEVGDPGASTTVDHDVGGLQIPVQHEIVMGRGETRAELAGDIDALIVRQASDPAKEVELFVAEMEDQLRKARGDVFGDAAVIQRCPLHKGRNLDALVPKARHAYGRAALRRAYRAASAGAARRQLTALATWLERNGQTDAAASVREGLEETLTVLKLGLPPALRRFFATTNCIENLIGTLRHVTRNIKRWRDGDMRRRWIGLGLLRAAERFRRIKHHGELGALVIALGSVVPSERAA